MTLSPVILFVYNRPEHTVKTLETLRRNDLAGQSELYVFSDGPRSRKDQDAVESVRRVVESLDGFRKITVIKRPENMGLARSVIAGVTEVINQYGKVIVVEDDLHVSPVFLEYMNRALNLYEKCIKIFSIGGYSPPIAMPASYDEDSYLSYRGCTWGWGTWKDRWEKADWAVKDFEEFINDPRAVSLFNRGGEDLSQILQLQMKGKVDSWGIRWDYAHFKNNACCFRPTGSLVTSFGNDGSGVHCGKTDKYDAPLCESKSHKFQAAHELTVSEEINNRFATFYDGKERPSVCPPAVDASFPTNSASESASFVLDLIKKFLRKSKLLSN